MSRQFSVLIIDSDPRVREMLTDITQATPGAKLLAVTDSPTYGYELIRQNRPKVVFLDLSSDPQKILQLASKISAYFNEALIVGSGPEFLYPPFSAGGALPAAGGSGYDPASMQAAAMATLKACMTAGIREYLPRPFDESSVKTVFDKYKAALSIDEREGDRTGRIISVYSNKGGLGKTTIAVNLAVALSEVIRKPVAIVDLNFQLGDVTTFLDVEPKQTVVDIARNIARVDKDYLLNSLAQFRTDKAEVYVLADPLNVEDAEELTSDQINAVLTVLRASFEYVVIDTTASFDAKTLCALDLSDQIMMVSIVNLPSIRSSQRLLGLFSRLEYPLEKIKLVINRYIPDEEITLDDVTDTLEHPIFWKIPNNYRVIMAAINRGIPIDQVENGHDMHNQFLGLARRISGTLDGGASTAASQEEMDTHPGRKSIFGDLIKKMTSG